MTQAAAGRDILRIVDRWARRRSFPFILHRGELPPKVSRHAADQMRVKKWIWVLLARGVLAQTTPVSQAPGNLVQEAIGKQRAAAAVQRGAVRKQVEMAAQWRAFGAASDPIPSEVAEVDCSAIPDVELGPLVAAAATVHEIQPELLRAVIEQE